ncbi:putative cation/H+ exchanger, CPA1 family [Lupinus albus]|uniref:Putative cation/H+ exchanger, CPA1 family n=1 Tax=Lupinus albus TaxID=3870 RepID=A0A6A4NP03_LUPAL|nr:putative cation/H+ exchanger, CPA1 family [Lupinus albus]
MIMVPLNLVAETVRNLAHDHAQVVPISLFVAVLCLCLVIGHLLEENRWVNESIVAIIVVSHNLSLFQSLLLFV